MRRAIAVLVGALVLLGGTAWAAPNDPGWYQQWNLTKIRAHKAWATSKGSGVVVAVVDTGVDLNHPDLKGRLVSGVDLVDGGSPQDDNGHGTFMAGIVAARTGNGVGVASVAPAAKIMPVKVLNANGVGQPERVAEGIRWAVAHGAHVINLSLAETSGGGVKLPLDFFSNSELDEAIRDAAAAGRFVAIAAGNDFSSSGGKSQTAYDAEVSGALVVGATTSADKRAKYSNYGQGLDVMAPGGGSATDATTGACQPNDPVISTWWSGSSQYGAGCGTSMAVAHVSGMAALLKARGFSAAGAANRIVATAKSIGGGMRRVDALAAVGGSTSQAPPAAKPPATKKNNPQPQVSAAAPPGATPTAAPSPAPTPPPAPSPTATPPAGLLLAAEDLPGESPEPRKALLTIAAALALMVGVAHPLARFTMRAR